MFDTSWMTADDKPFGNQFLLLGIVCNNSCCFATVFLGGSCDPTTWRADIAVPLLNKAKVPYFNPQIQVTSGFSRCSANALVVSCCRHLQDWHPGLIQQEAKAKEVCARPDWPLLWPSTRLFASGIASGAVCHRWKDARDRFNARGNRAHLSTQGAGFLASANSARRS
jgi:hypothetical protein